MKQMIFTVLFISIFLIDCYSQGSFTQTTSSQFNQNVNYNINTSNNELKLTLDLGTESFSDVKRMILIK